MKKILLPLLLLIAICGQSQTKTIIDSAEKEMKSGNTPKAIVILDKAIDENPDAFELYHARGRAYIELEKFQQAVDDFGKALQLNPESAEVYNSRGLLFNALGYADEALADAEKAMQLASSGREKNVALNIRADGRRTKKDYPGAVADYEALLAARPEPGIEMNALIGIAKVLGAQQKNKEAIFYLEKLTAAYPKMSIGFTNLAFRYAEIGDYKKAIELNDKVIAIERHTKKDANGAAKVDKKVMVKGSDLAIALAYNNKGYAQYKLGDTAAALQSINQSIGLYPENSYAYRNRALAYLALNSKEAACADIDKSLELGFTEAYGDEMAKLKQANCK